MTSKEALEELRFQVGNITYYTKDLQRTTFEVRDSGLFEIIENDLEVLEKYKQIEKELGIDLITFVSAFKNGIYCLEHGDEIVYLEPYYLGMDTFGEWHWTADTTFKCLKDYGKTWALTKEELEK